MFSPGKLIWLALVAAVVYGGFFAVPAGPRAEGQFDPERLATDEVDVLKAVAAREEWGTYAALVPMLREQHRYSWFRAAQASYYEARALTTFPELTSRYERVLPDLEDAATIERDWMDAVFDPMAVARAELTWWVTRKMPNLNSADQVAPLISDEYSLRYHLAPGQAMDAALRRAEALELAGRGGNDPDWPGVEKLLTESNRALKQAIAHPHSLG
jgi:hypothetical protein